MPGRTFYHGGHSSKVPAFRGNYCANCCAFGISLYLSGREAVMAYIVQVYTIHTWNFEITEPCGIYPARVGQAIFYLNFNLGMINSPLEIWSVIQQKSEHSLVCHPIFCNSGLLLSWTKFYLPYFHVRINFCQSKISSGEESPKWRNVHRGEKALSFE